MLLDERWLPALSRLRLVAPLRPQGTRPAWRPAPRPGSGLDFLTHREYMPGDDFRTIDWTVLARLDRPYVRLRAREEDLAVELLLDTSDSMARPDARKLEFAASVAACLGYVALMSGERLRLFLPGGEAMARRQRRSVSGPGHEPLGRLLGMLRAARPCGRTDLAGWASALTDRWSGPALTLVLSDLMEEPEHVRAALEQLHARGRSVVLIHVLSAGEQIPDLAGEMRLVDVEDHEPVHVRADPSLLGQYVKVLARWQDELRAQAARFRAPYVLLSAPGSPYDAVIRNLRAAGVVR